MNKNIIYLTILFVSHNNASVISADESGVDWPLVVGSFSAGVLFLCSVVVVAVVAHRKGISHVNLCFSTDTFTLSRLPFFVKCVISSPSSLFTPL